GDPAAALALAVGRLIAAIASERPLVLLVDDWHRADAGSASLVKQLAAQGDPAVWWCLAADGDVADFAGERRELAPLTSEEVASLMAANLGVAEAPESVLAQIEASAGGNPRMVEELLRYMLAHKQIVRRQSGWVLAQGATGELPTGLQELYAARAADFTPGERALAEALALATCALPAGCAAHASGLSPEAADAAASGLLARGLVLESASGLALTDGQLGAWLAGQLDPEAAKARHGAIHEAIALITGPRPPVRLVNALAHHGLSGPTPAAALPWLELAARANLELRALAAAKRFAEAAVEYGASAPARERVELLELLATARRGLDEADAALAVAEEAARLAETLDDPALLARSLNGLGKIHQLASRYDEAKAAFGRAITVAEPAGTAPLELARSHRALARLAFFGGDMDGSARHGKEALSLVRRHADPATLAEVLVEVGEMMQGEEERLYEGLVCMEEAQTLARELDNEHLESSTAAKGSFKRAVELYEKLGNVGEALFARLNLALIAVEQGFFPEAETVAAQVGTDAKAANRKFPMAVAWAIEGASQASQGRSVEGLKRLAEAAAVAEEIKHGYLRAIVRQLEAPVRLLLGQLDEAGAEARALAEFGASAGVAELTERAGLVLTELAWLTGAADEADAALDPLLSATHIAVRAEAQILRARMAISRSDEKTAHQALHAARGLLGEVDAPKLDVEFWLVEAELSALEGEEPAAILEHAVKRLEETQSRHALVLALSTLARLGPAKGRRASTARALELLNPLAAAMGEDRARYMAAYGREAIGHAERASEPTGAVPGSIGEMRLLMRRLEAGLDQLERDGLGGDGGQAARRLDQVVAFARAVNSTLELDEVTDRALSLIIEITGAERGLLLLRDGAADGLNSARFKAAPGYEDAAGAEQYSRTIAHTVIETGEMVCVLDALSDQRFAQQASVMGLNLQTIICVPLKEHDKTIGAIYVDRQGLSDQFMESDLEVVQGLSSLTAQAISNARLMKQQQERQVHLEMLNRLSRTISRTLELDRVLDLITEMTLEMAKAERAFVFLFENEQLVFGAGRDADGPLPAHASREVSRSVCQKVVETQSGVYVIDAGKDEEFSTKRSVMNLKLGSIIAVPLMGQAGMTGVLYIDSKTRLVSHLEKEMMVLQSVGNTASLAIDNAKLYRQATVDGLTGLYVRSFFMLRLNEEIRRSKRFGNKFSLLVMDIDHFKRFNDTYGHATGDAVLKLVATTIKNGVRLGLDLPCRYGGEEMLALLPETDAPGAVITAERIRKAIEEASFPGPDGEPVRVTISIGVASFPEMAESATELFERADQALYASKRGGRNRVTVYDASLSESSAT
ncbi:MAG: diguanylate cyclase, partial [Candidatus Sericytochromatia bacterium]